VKTAAVAGDGVAVAVVEVDAAAVAAVAVVAVAVAVAVVVVVAMRPSCRSSVRPSRPPFARTARTSTITRSGASPSCASLVS
jgi:hypothetical protein